MSFTTKVIHSQNSVLFDPSGIYKLVLTCGEMLSDVVILERRNGPHRLSDNDDDDDVKCKSELSNSVYTVNQKTHQNVFDIQSTKPDRLW